MTKVAKIHNKLTKISKNLIETNREFEDYYQTLILVKSAKTEMEQDLIYESLRLLDEAISTLDQAANYIEEL